MNCSEYGGSVHNVVCCNRHGLQLTPDLDVEGHSMSVGSLSRVYIPCLASCFGVYGPASCSESGHPKCSAVASGELRRL